eukprot:TRINITY_DN8097_c0_g1_i1.p1 TRINITY_DN8097_c0_g1~~TRINITY_DN8097_c0_g1_i1.p1  ORF type:complete len:234 (+),score=48.03 TRINITY_DN8097_c0_g1_i1:112-813(+)
MTMSLVARSACVMLAALVGLLCSRTVAAQHTANSASAHYYNGALAGVACQTPWIQSASADSFGGYVTAWHNTNTPSYNAQCGQCIKLTSTQSGKNYGKSIFVTVVDLKGWDGFDVNVPAWQTLFGTSALDVYSINWAQVDACNCSGNKNCGTSTTPVANKCDKCNLPASSGGCKCDANCNCLTTGGTGTGVAPCDKCKYCKCNSSCGCINKCDLCNVPASAGGCKCNSNCDCI